MALRYKSWCILEQRGGSSREFQQTIVSCVVRLQRRPGFSIDRHRLHQRLLPAGEVREHEELGQHLVEKRKTTTRQGASPPKCPILYRRTANVFSGATEQSSGAQQRASRIGRFVSRSIVKWTRSVPIVEQIGKSGERGNEYTDHVRKVARKHTCIVQFTEHFSLNISVKYCIKCSLQREKI